MIQREIKHDNEQTASKDGKPWDWIINQDSKEGNMWTTRRGTRNDTGLLVEEGPGHFDDGEEWKLCT